MKKVWTKKGLGKHKFFGKWLTNGKHRFFALISETYGKAFEYNGPPSAKAAGWRCK